MTIDTNGHHAQAPAADIAYGDLPNQRLSPEWAEGVLRELFTTRPELFGACLSAYVTGIRKAAPGRKPAGAGQ